MSFNQRFSDAAHTHRMRDFERNLQQRQQSIMRESFIDREHQNDHYYPYDHLQRTTSPSQLLPKLPRSPGLDDIQRITPQANLRSSRYPVIPPLTPPDDGRAGPHFPHNSYATLEDPYGISSEQVRTKQQQRNHRFFAEDQRLENLRYRETSNPLHDIRDGGPIRSTSIASHRRQAKAKSLEVFTRDLAVDILNETTGEMIQSLAHEMSIISEQRLWELYSEDSRYYHPCLTSLQDDVLNEELRAVIKEVVNEMVTDYFKAKTMIKRPLDEKPEMTDLITENIPEIFSEVFEINISEEVLSSMVSDVVQEVLTSEVEPKETLRSEVKPKVVADSNVQVSQLTTDLIIDGLELDHLLMKLANHRQVWNDSEVKDMLLDSILASEFTQLFHLMSAEGQRSCDVLPLKRFHENTTTDYSLDFLLGELTTTLDEDLEDLLEYEYMQETTATSLDSQTR